ncbi:MAG: tetratricopeptide repeat protein [Chitinivibrionales bacterium]|nr:tetratricopeptide repeat protein [Chitinivibrionales bacterium]MBD3356244.1 tetratricopeptide repeat protein [Chitinivibrionales bacterium]
MPTASASTTIHRVYSSCFFSRLFVLIWLFTVTNAVELEFTFEDSDERDALPGAVIKAGEKAYALNQKGLDALERGDLDSALGYFESASDVLVGYSDAVNNRGVVYFRRGTVFRAEEIWKALAAADPDYAIVHYNLGVAAFYDKEYKKARRYLARGLQCNPRFHQALIMLGRVDMVEGKKRDAVRHWEKAYDIAPRERDVWAMYAYGSVEIGDTTRAEKVLLRHTDTHYALEMLGEIEAGRGKPARAARYFAEAVAKGGPPSILASLALMQMDNGECSKSLRTINHYLARVSPPSADALLLAGVAAKECGRMADATKRFEEGVRLYPNDPLLRFNLGQMLFYVGDYERAEGVWAPLADTLRDPSLFHLRALAARHRGKRTEAKEHIRQALALDTRAEYYDVLGVLLYESGDTTAAVENFQKALKMDPEHRSAQLNLALVTKEKRALAATAQKVRQRLDTCALRCGGLALELAILHFHAGDIDKAQEVLRAVPESERTEGIVRHEAVFHRMKGNLTEAISVLERGEEKFVLDVETEHELAQCYMEAGLYAKAIAVFESLLDRWRRNPWRIYYQMGYANMERNDLSQARECFQRSLRVRRDNPAARALLAFVLNRMGYEERARELWAEHLREDSSNPVMWANMGLALEKEGDYEGALEKYHRALRLDPEKHALWINIGNAYLAMGKYEKAWEAYRGALDSPKREVAAYNAFIAAQRKGKKSRASQMVDILRDEYPGTINARRADGELALWNGDTARALELLSGLPQKNDNDWYALAKIYVARGLGDEAGEAISRLPHDSLWTYARNELTAQLAFYEGRYDSAYELWKAGGDTSFSTRYNMALAALQAKRYDDALRLGEKLIGAVNGRDRVRVCRMIGNAAFGLEDWETARRWYEQLSGLDSRNPLVQYNLAVAWYNLGDIEKAWKHYQRARRLDPTLSNVTLEKHYQAESGEEVGTQVVMDTLDSLYNQAVAFQNDDNDSSAQLLYRLILKRDSRYYPAWNNLGAIYAEQGELDSAKVFYANAISRRHDLVEAYANLANIHIALEEYDKAHRWLLKGELHNPGNELMGRMRSRLDQARAGDQGNDTADTPDR